MLSESFLVSGDVSQESQVPFAICSQVAGLVLVKSEAPCEQPAKTCNDQFAVVNLRTVAKTCKGDRPF